MKVFIAGICGTFMAGIAQIAKSMGHDVSGCDANVYPPMSTVLDDAGIEVKSGYLAEHIDPDNEQGSDPNTNQVIIGNALSRGNPLVEAVLDNGLRYQSGPQWLHDQLLTKKQVVAVAGTHGKTSTSSMVAWILENNDLDPGFLIGGKPGNFPLSARVTAGEHFVIEADEYDTAFFDKRSKFVHYSPNIAVLNNLEFDHGDIFDNLGEIKTQFHHLLRIIPHNGHVVVNDDDHNLREVLDMGCWSTIHRLSTQDQNADWFAKSLSPDCRQFEVYRSGEKVGFLSWDCMGAHNMQNALAAIAAATLCGVSVEDCTTSLTTFIPAARRLQLLFSNENTHLFEDFAHHPTAIKHTLETLKARYPEHTIIAVMEPRSNTMKSGYHNNELGPALDSADIALVYQPEDQGWDISDISSKASLSAFDKKQDLLDDIHCRGADNRVIICMSNGSFDGIPALLKKQLQST